MPELPDITVYLDALRERIHGRALERVRVVSPFLLRSVDTPIESAVGSRVVDLRRLGKRIAIGFESDLWFVIHLMIAGRFQWRPTWPDKPTKLIALVLQFGSGVLVLTEAGTKKRASLHVVRGAERLAEHDPGGLEVAASGAAEFLAALRSGNHTLKRALTDPHLLSGIGNAYSDEILHAARISPMVLTSKLTPEAIASLHAHTIAVLTKWRDDLIAETGDRFPEKVTAFREGMAAHGRYGKPCPACGTPIQRIQYAANEANYCPTCQTGGKLLADRGLSRLLKGDWPKSLDELEKLKAARQT
jgi:formamidopyrimidine-DNA glycosylase